MSTQSPIEIERLQASLTESNLDLLLHEDQTLSGKISRSPCSIHISSDMHPHSHHWAFRYHCKTHAVHWWKTTFTPADDLTCTIGGQTR